MPHSTMVSKTGKLPKIAGLTEKPAPIRSGKPLKERVKICYRSDLYMKEQRKNVILFQEQLRHALNDLKTAKPDSLAFHTNRVEQLKIKADEMIIILQICGKINRELAYARQDLLSAIEQGGESQLINKRRKRVQWLESKLEEIIIQHSPARKDDAEDAAQSDMDFGNRYSDMGNNSLIDKSIMSSLPADMSGLQTADTNGRLNTAATSTSQFQRSANGPILEEIIGANQSGNRLVLPERPDVIVESSIVGSVADSGNVVDTRQLALAATPQRPSQSKLSFREPLESGMETTEQRPTTSRDGKQEADRDSMDFDDEEYEDDDDNSDQDYGSRTDGKSRSEMSAVSSLFTDVTDEGTRRTRRSSRRQDAQNSPRSKQSADHLNRQVSRVTVKSPDVKAQQRDDYDSPTEEYWESEHHRVEFSALRPYLSELDPNSLHQVAIAVPGNYVNKPPSGQRANLPWREPEDNRDVNREALDRLSRQIIQIQDQVYEAAIRSVDSMGNRMATRASRRDISSMTKGVGRSTTMSSRQYAQTATSLPLIPDQQEDSQNRFTPVVHLKYYSKEIPKAKTLPISRVNRDKCYPQALTSFVFPDHEGKLAPDRIVNQGRLYNDTKLVIYRAPNRKRLDFREEAKMVTVTQSEPTMVSDKTTSNISLRTASKMALALGALRADDTADCIRRATSPSGDNLAPPVHEEASSEVSPVRHVGLKWDRVKYLFESGLKSKHMDERQNAAKQLGLLQCWDSEVFHALKTAIIEDTDERVQYEATKALVRLGCLEDELIQILVDYLIIGNEEVRLDALKTLSEARGISFINKNMSSFDELIQVLAHLCNNMDTDDLASFEAAIAFGTICVKNAQAVEKMTHYLNHGSDTHKKAVALRILIKQFNESHWNLVEVVLQQFTKSPVWGYRREAAQLLQHLGRKHACNTSEREELVYSILEKRLWDDSVEMVRMEAAHTLGVLDMYPRAAETVIKRLSAFDPTIRAHAVTSLGTLGIKQPKILRVLIEMLELDPSDNVRREVIRAFGSQQITDKKIIRLIKERERGEGILAVEARHVLKILESL